MMSIYFCHDLYKSKESKHTNSFILYALCKPIFKKDVKAVNRKKILRLKNGNGNNIRKHKVVKSQSQS